MKKLEKRAIFCLVLAGLLLLSGLVFTVRFIKDGSTWASFPSNRHLYRDGVLTAGDIVDRNGILLSATENGKRIYNQNRTIRMATLHAVGDPSGQIGTGAQTAFAGKLAGYNVITGAYPIGGSRDLYLTIDANVCSAAYQALNGRKGTVGVYNYKTGDILCMVSTPAFDPAAAASFDASDPAMEGAYLNRFLSSTFIPGSVFKLVTTAAAIDTVGDLDTRTFHCAGRLDLPGVSITCQRAHGDLSIAHALAVSCNCTFGQLAMELGADTMEQYVEKTGLTKSLSVSGIRTAAGTFSFSDADRSDLAWGGIGQGRDMVNPCSMMVYMGAIANGGAASLPQIVSRFVPAQKFSLPVPVIKPGSTGQLLSVKTADQLRQMMRNNVVSNYGAGNFPGLDLCAKSGTAEVGGGNQPHAWFTGFLQDEAHPYAFIVLVENGGSGASVAGRVANQVLQAAVRAE